MQHYPFPTRWALPNSISLALTKCITWNLWTRMSVILTTKYNNVKVSIMQLGAFIRDTCMETTLGYKTNRQVYFVAWFIVVQFDIAHCLLARADLRYWNVVTLGGCFLSLEHAQVVKLVPGFDSEGMCHAGRTNHCGTVTNKYSLICIWRACKSTTTIYSLVHKVEN